MFHITVLMALLLAAPLTAQDVSPEGRLRRTDSAAGVASPGGLARLRRVRVRGDHHDQLSDLRVSSNDGTARVLRDVPGDGFLVTDGGQVVAMEVGHHEAQAQLRVYDERGRLLVSRQVAGLRDAQLSSDGSALLFGSLDGVQRLGLGDLAITSLGSWGQFAGGPAGVTAGILRGDGRTLEVLLPRGVRKRQRLSVAPLQLAFHGGLLYLRFPRSLMVLDTTGGSVARTVYEAPAGSDLRDLWISPLGPRLGLRTLSAMGERRGTLLGLQAGGRFLPLTHSASVPTTAANLDPVPLGSIPWPLAPMGPYGIGNTYGEYQRYGGSPYLHPGIDVFGADLQPVYSVASGVVKAVLTTSGSYHWRVAIGQAGAGTSEGYLYAHLDQPSIAVQVGDVVAQGQYLGDLVPWPVSGFTHTHFARIESSGNQWFGNWLCTDNPHMDLYPKLDSMAPQFEPAVGSQLFAFTANQSSNYQDPGALVGAVDVIAHVSDRVETSYECAVQGLRYTIHPVGDPDHPVVAERLAYHADMALDTYQNGPIDPFLVDLLFKQDSTCQTEGNYGSREFFHILTNSDGDEVYSSSDLGEAWDTSLLSDGDYVIVVRAWDAAGNSTTASMTVTTANGNP